MSSRVYMTPNPFAPGEVVTIDPELCDGCNICVERCRSQVLLPNPEEGKPPLIVYPEECWFGACCEAHCPREAIKLIHPLNQRIAWKRKETGEYFRIGIANPPLPNTRPPYGYFST
jgi:NAD-dependent dihydropyrimidine dehydrogenase PreA subunit